MKTLDQPQIPSNSPGAEREKVKTRSPYVTSASKTMRQIEHQRKKLFPIFIGSALISGMSLIGFFLFLLHHSPSVFTPRPTFQESVRPSQY